MRQKLGLKTKTDKALIGIIAVAVLTVFSIIPTSKASAHYVYRDGTLYYSSLDCVDGRSEVSHGTGQGYSRADINVAKIGSDSHDYCGDSFQRPSGYIRVRMALMYWTTQWNTCHDTGYLYNSNTTSHMTITRTYGSVCGGRNYDTQSWMHELNGSWKGGILWSGSHKLPI